MRTKLAVNIDTVDFSVDGENGSFVIPNTTSAQVISPDGEILTSYQNRVAIPGKFGAHKLSVRTLNSGAKLEVQGSPYATLYGQNVFTSSDLKTGVLDALKKVCKTFRISPTKEQKQRWSAGDIDLERVGTLQSISDFLLKPNVLMCYARFAANLKNRAAALEQVVVRFTGRLRMARNTQLRSTQKDHKCDDRSSRRVAWQEKLPEECSYSSDRN